MEPKLIKLDGNNYAVTVNNEKVCFIDFDTQWVVAMPREEFQKLIKSFKKINIKSN